MTQRVKEFKPCPECSGFGSVAAVDSLGYECEPDCPDCGGSGKVPADYISWADIQTQALADLESEQAARRDAERQRADWPNGEGMPF